MRNPFIGLAQWVVRHIVSFFIIVIILVVGAVVQSKYRSLEITKTEITELKSGELNLQSSIEKLQSETGGRVAKLKAETKDKVEERIRAIDSELKTINCSSIGITPAFLINKAECKAKEQFLGKEKEALQTLQQRLTTSASLPKLINEQKIAYQAHLDNRKRYDEMVANHTEHLGDYFRTEVIGYKGLNSKDKELIDDYNKKTEARNAAEAKLNLLNKKLESSLKSLSQFTGTALKDLNAEIKEKEKSVRENLVGRMLNLAGEKIPAAIMILVGIIFSPLIIKALFYFVIAPFAARRPPVCILPDTNGLMTGVGGISAKSHETQKVSSVSIPITLRASQELLIHPEYLQSIPTNGKIRTKWLLDWAYPLTSMAAGMVALTQISGVDGETVVISSTNDPLSEVGWVEIPEGSSVVLQPHCLIGLSYQKGASPKITKHWQLGSLHAWLTLQLRYLVFHGPVNIALKGCRGIRIESADSGRAINQAATMGFSANIKYSTYRCETFASYLLGEKELFNDSFSGTSGYYIYEEMPHFGKRGGVTGRGLEGITDSVLKVFGV
ncbi:hypothetical protein [Ferriphaselus sp. R-1]|uniref:hypothetical protein n=1 Tax=Ferriphaselus sp. R-1 TaxID=1485544 RepID=UPI00054DBD39|nr:hypothetical protein [Ferriphaselus sp. R-1]